MRVVGVVGWVGEGGGPGQLVVFLPVPESFACCCVGVRYTEELVAIGISRNVFTGNG